MAAVKTYQRTYDYFYFFYQLPVSVDASYSEYMISATLTLQEEEKNQSSLHKLTYFNQSTLMQQKKSGFTTQLAQHTILDLLNSLPNCCSGRLYEPSCDVCLLKQDQKEF